MAALFYATYKSEKILYQLGQIAHNSFKYADRCLLVNNRIVKKSFFVNPHIGLYLKLEYMTGILFKS